MSRLALLATAVLAFSQFSCGVGVASKKDLVRQRAQFDLKCDGKVDVVDIGNEKAFGARGCGRQASYIVDCTDIIASSCTAILNSDGKNEVTAD